MSRGPTYAVADIGSSKVCVVIGHQLSSGHLFIEGAGVVDVRNRRSRQLRPLAVAQAITEALEAAETSAGEEVKQLYVGVTTDAQRGENVVGDITIPNRPIRQADINAVLADAQSRRSCPERVVLHTLVQQFVVDRKQGVMNPIGRPAKRLRAQAHLVTVSESMIEALKKTSEYCSVPIQGVVAQPVASSFAALEPEESEDGVVLIDIGARTTDVMMWCNGVLVHSVTLGTGGEQITRAIATELGITLKAAGRLKCEYGGAELSQVDASEDMVWTCSQTHERLTMRRSLMVDVMERELRVLLGRVHRELQSKGLLEELGGGVVLAGGTSELPGLVTLVESMFGVPARTGMPPEAEGLGHMIRQPRYAAAMGLLRYVAGTQHAELVHALHEPSAWERMWTTARRAIDQFI